ncbi:hypothetical protein ACN4EE_23060 [Geminocystis sp. CENA526]|uniref:hypothetical protein n=1 Tax=Geminocystis sp. CENA526 TaxID=1355871 RepID=UPI003D701C7D
MELNTQIPDVLYQQIETLAKQQNIPVEELITMALSSQISSWLTKDYLTEKAQQGSWEQLQKVLTKVPNCPPEDYDQL